MHVIGRRKVAGLGDSTFRRGVFEAGRRRVAWWGWSARGWWARGSGGEGADRDGDHGQMVGGKLVLQRSHRLCGPQGMRVAPHLGQLVRSVGAGMELAGWTAGIERTDCGTMGRRDDPSRDGAFARRARAARTMNSVRVIPSAAD